MLPSIEEQQKIASPAIRDAMSKGFSYEMLAMVLGSDAETLKDIYEGRGTDDLLKWTAIEVHLH